MNEIETRLTSATPGVSLAGTLCIPADCAAAALLLPGSGPQDRDETLAGQKPLRELAIQLAERGVASLRCDDRGVGGSGGDYLSIDGPTLLADAAAQIDWLRDNVPCRPCAVIGHSQGALFALRLAQIREMDRAVLLAGAVRPGMLSMMGMREQMADDSGFEGQTREAYLSHSRSLFEAIASIDDPDLRRSAVRDLVSQSVSGAADTDLQPDFESVAEYIEFAVEDAMEWEVRELLRSDPAAELARLRTPVLALWGSMDRHLDPEAERAAFEAAAPSASHAQVLPGLNHLFQQSDTGALEAYAHDGPSMQPPIAEITCDFLFDNR